MKLNIVNNFFLEDSRVLLMETESKKLILDFTDRLINFRMIFRYFIFFGLGTCFYPRTGNCIFSNHFMSLYLLAPNIKKKKVYTT